jgi:hypothetical protein
MSMNTYQRSVLITAAAAVGAAFIYPPFHYRDFGLGFGWIFSPPYARAQVSVGLLLAEWVGILLMATIAYVIAGSRSAADRQTPVAGVTLNSVDAQIGKHNPHVHPMPRRLLRMLLRTVLLLIAFVVCAAVFGIVSELSKALGVYVLGTTGITVVIISALVWVWRISGRLMATTKPADMADDQSSDK